MMAKIQLASLDFILVLKSAVIMSPSPKNFVPQCGAPPPEVVNDKKDGSERNDPELPHDYRCNQEFHNRAEIDKSRREFNWKVVEPYDGMLQKFFS